LDEADHGELAAETALKASAKHKTAYPHVLEMSTNRQHTRHQPKAIDAESSASPLKYRLFLI